MTTTLPHMGTQTFNPSLYSRLAKPTKHLPGSQGKFRLLCLRMKFGVPLWIEGDAGTYFAKVETPDQEKARRHEREACCTGGRR